MTNFRKHLYFETLPESREYLLNKCIDILGLIASLKDRQEDIRETAQSVYGVNNEGKLMASPDMVEKYKRNNATMKRLKQYYNYRLLKVANFKITAQ